MTDTVRVNVIDRRSRLRRLLRLGRTEEHVHIVLRDLDGRVVSEQHVYNTVTANGRNAIADQLLAAPTLAKPAYMAIGTGAPAANALGVEVARVALTSKTRTNAVVTYVGDFPAGTPAGTNVITEAAVMDAAAAGNMHNSTTFGGQSKDPNLSMTINWTLTVS